MTREEFFYQCIDVIEHWLNGNRKLSDLREVTDKLYNEVTKPHWISVEDELPPKEDEFITDISIDVLATDGKTIHMCFYDYNLERWLYGDLWRFDDVTHWMYLPSVEHLKK